MRVRQLVLASCLAFAASAAAQQPVPPSGFALGRVVDAESGRGIAGVLVFLTMRTPTSQQQGLPRGLTDADGRFLFADVPAGSYTIRTTMGGTGFSPSGFVVSGSGHQIGPYINGAYGQRRPDGPESYFDLPAGGRMSDLVVRLWKGAAIEGSVVDESGEPQVDVYVAAAARTSDGRLLTGPSTRTDDRGRFRIGTLKPGEYVVVVPHTQYFMPSASIGEILAASGASAIQATQRATGPSVPSLQGLMLGSSVVTAAATGGQAVHSTVIPPQVFPDGRVLVYRTTFFPASPTVAGATPIRLRAGETRGGVTVTLEPVPATRVTGTLIDNMGPVPNFTVRLMPAGVEPGSASIEVATTLTDSRGAFEFPAVAPGAYTLMASRQTPMQGRAGSAPTDPGVRLADLVGSFAREPVTVGRAPGADVALVLRPGFRLQGRAEFVGATARPLNREVVFTLRPTPAASRLNTSFNGAVVDGNDRVLFSPNPAGSYLIDVSTSATWALQSITLDGRDVTDRVFRLDRDSSDVVATFSDRAASVTGSVRLPRGIAADEVSVFLLPADRERWRDGPYGTRVFRTVRVSVTGSFDISPVIPGAYFVAAARDGMSLNWPDPSVLTRLATAGSAVTVEPGRATTVSVLAVELP